MSKHTLTIQRPHPVHPEIELSITLPFIQDENGLCVFRLTREAVDDLADKHRPVVTSAEVVDL